MQAYGCVNQAQGAQIDTSRGLVVVNCRDRALPRSALLVHALGHCNRPLRAYCEAWKTNGNETSTEPPAGAGKRQRATSDLMQLATSASPSVSCSTSTPGHGAGLR